MNVQKEKKNQYSPCKKIGIS